MSSFTEDIASHSTGNSVGMCLYNVLRMQVDSRKADTHASESISRACTIEFCRGPSAQDSDNEDSTTGFPLYWEM